MQSFNSKCVSARVHTLLKLLIPATHELCILDLQLPEDQQNPVFQQFYNTLIRGAELVKKCENISPLSLLVNYRYASQILKLEKEIHDFMGLMPTHILLDARRLMADLKKLYHAQKLHAEDISRIVNEPIFEQASMLTNDPCENTIILQQMVLDDLCDSTEMVVDSAYSYHDSAPGKNNIYLGLEKSMGNLKELLFQNQVSVVGVKCMGGGGKTTLALALCNDPQIKGYFGNNVHFVTVSQSPNLKLILENMWEKIVGTKRHEFQNVEDAHIQLQQQLLKQSKPTLVILDDVWSRANLEKLLFEGTGYKTLITTRDSSTIPRNSYTQLYTLPLLGQEDALSLFCFWAFGQTSIPTTADANLVKQVQAECKGLPLALKVIGSSLHGEPHVAWESARTKLSKGELISDYHKEGLFRCLETSIDLLDDVVRECFLDLGSFPEDTKVCADALLDIWIYVRNLEWNDAFVILLELARRNLLNLTTNPGSPAAISYGSASELYFSQHDVMRDLALYLGCQDGLLHRKRLLMPRKEHSLPGTWEFLDDKQFGAQIVSIDTGSMQENEWCQMNFPKTEALVLLCTASEYCLPPFIKSMKKLKFLMVSNYGSKRATMKGLDALSSLTELKSVRLERLIASPIQKQSKALQNLEKLSLSLCEGFGSVSTFNNTKLRDFNLDHCSDLEELPPNICHMPSAQMWSITNCHLVQKLPYDLGNLSSVRMLRLSALPGLQELHFSSGNRRLWWWRCARMAKCLRNVISHVFRHTQARPKLRASITSEAGEGQHIKWDYRGQRKGLPLGPWVPDIAVDAFVAPNAVVCGQVEVQDSSSLWYGSVLRGDLNKVFVGFCSNIQEKCVLHAAPSSPTGLPAETFIDRFVTIGAYSLLRSCHIEFESIIGQRCVLMEGSLVETHAVLEAGSVLPPGRRIPSGELWAGNPARFVRLLTPDEVAEIPKIAKAVSYIAQNHASEFLPYSTAYLEVEKLKNSLSFPL